MKAHERSSGVPKRSFVTLQKTGFIALFVISLFLVAACKPGDKSGEGPRDWPGAKSECSSVPQGEWMPQRGECPGNTPEMNKKCDDFCRKHTDCCPGWQDRAQQSDETKQPIPDGSPDNPRQPFQGEQMPEPDRSQSLPPNVPAREEFSFQNLKSKSLPSKPKGELVKKQLGDLEVSYFSTAIARGMSESGVDFFITVKNKGSSDVDVYMTPDKELLNDVPKWNLHFYSFQDYPFRIKAGETRKIWYYASVDQPGEFTVNFNLWFGSDANNKIAMPVIFGQFSEDFRKDKETSFIYGYVKDDKGQPVAGKQLVVLTNCGRLDFSGTTDGDGKYMIRAMAMEDINEIYAGKEVACDSKDYFITFVDDNYGFYFKNNLAPTRDKFVSLNITVPSKTEEKYSLKWEKKVDDNYGFFWVKPSADFSVFAVSQAKHPPELGKATNFYMFDSNGNILWKQPTNNECWGIDITADGSKVAAGCHDGTIYMMDKAGKSLWQYTDRAMARSVCFSKDGKKAFSGGIGTLFLFDADAGSKTDVPWIDEWFRNCKFSDDGSFVAASRTVVGFDSSANKKWEYVMGEFPLFLAIDSSKNVYASGKSRELFSFDANGNLRWKHRLPDHTATAGAATPDGSRIVLGTVGSMVYLFDSDGNLLWKRGTMDPGQGDSTIGHNAIAISDDGKRIVAGTAPGNCVVLYDENGSALWQDCRKTEVPSNDYLVGVTNVAISKDKKSIIASYGDNYIREFVIS